MNKAYYLVLALTFAPMCGYAQQHGEPQGQAAERGHEMPATRPSTFEQVDHIRKELGLTQKQFDKVYSAYSKYNKAVYGDEPFSGMGGGMPQGGRGGMGDPVGGGMGGPGGGGMGGPSGGGMGGPGGGGMGGPGGGGMGGPGGGFGGGRPEGMSSNSGSNKAPKEMTEKELEKRRKKLEKQEQKLEKSMRKALNSDDLFGRWQEMHEKQKPHGGPGMPPQPFDKPADAEPEAVAK
jgi:hypothetical protein